MFYECDVCDRTFANASSRLRHKKIVHTNKIPTVKRQTLTVNGVAVMQNYSHALWQDVRKVERPCGLKLSQRMHRKL